MFSPLLASVCLFTKRLRERKREISAENENLTSIYISETNNLLLAFKDIFLSLSIDFGNCFCHSGLLGSEEEGEETCHDMIW